MQEKLSDSATVRSLGRQKRCKKFCVGVAPINGAFASLQERKRRQRAVRASAAREAKLAEAAAKEMCGV